MSWLSYRRIGRMMTIRSWYFAGILFLTMVGIWVLLELLPLSDRINSWALAVILSPIVMGVVIAFWPNKEDNDENNRQQSE